MTNAYRLWISPSHIDRLAEARQTGTIIIGWAHAAELANLALTEAEFRDALRRQYYADDKNARRLGAAFANMWCFLHTMAKGDLVVSPADGVFHVAKVAGPPVWLADKVDDDTAFRRPAHWLTATPISRTIASDGLRHLLEGQRTTGKAGEFVSEIIALLLRTQSGIWAKAVAAT